MNKSLIFLLFFACISLPSCTTKNNNHSNRTKKTKRIIPVGSFVKIHSVFSIDECKKEKETACKTGTFASSGSGISIGMYQGGSVVLTAGHMCYVSMDPKFADAIQKAHRKIKGENIRGELLDGNVVAMTSGAMDQRDLCMVYIPNLMTDGVKIAARPPRIGEEVISLSAPVGIFHSPTFPILLGLYSGLIPGSPNALTTIPAVGGSSGSGILNENMALVGILYATAQAFNNISLISNYYQTMSFIEEGYETIINKNYSE